ncbi:MAG: hypothetical protein AB8B62_05095 [Roseobacter sp.]
MSHPIAAPLSQSLVKNKRSRARSKDLTFVAADGCVVFGSQIEAQESERQRGTVDMRRQQKWIALIRADQKKAGWLIPVALGTRKLAVYGAPNDGCVPKALYKNEHAKLCDGYFDDYLIEYTLHHGALGYAMVDLSTHLQCAP